MNYRKLFSIDLVQEYFAGSTGNPVGFAASVDTRKRLEYFSMSLLNTGQGCYIIHDRDNEKARQYTGNIFFAVAVYPGEDTRCFDLDIDYRQGRVYYVENSAWVGADAGTTGSLILAEQDAAAEFAAVPVLLQPGKFHFSLPAAPGDSLKLVDRQNQTVRQWNITTSPGTISLNADLSNNPPGIFRLDKNGNPTAYYYVDDGLYRKKPAFILGIEISSQDLQENAPPRAYEAKVKSRPVLWSYHVFLKPNGRKLTDIQIVNNNNKSLPGITFSVKSMDANGREVVFIANKPIPLAERGYTDITLSETVPPKGLLIPHLPNAELPSVKFKENQWISDIFVYI